jgi:hypothetical protein
MARRTVSNVLRLESQPPVTSDSSPHLARVDTLHSSEVLIHDDAVRPRVLLADVVLAFKLKGFHRKLATAKA